MVPFFPLLRHPTVTFSWTSFSVHWSTVVGIAALYALYEWRARSTPVPSLQSPVRPVQRASFIAGLVVMFLTLNGPIHDLSDAYLFSAHMVQHLALTLVVPPLLIAGTPGWMLRPALGRPWVRRWAVRVTDARAAFVIFNLTVAAWHIPELYNTAMAYHPVHIAQHLMFMVTATLMWWPLMSPLPEVPRLAYPGQMLYCFLMSIPMSIVAIFVALADHILYPAYSAAPRLWGISPALDQQAGGLIMWVPGGIFFIFVMTVVFFRWTASGADDRAGAQARA